MNLKKNRNLKKRGKIQKKNKRNILKKYSEKKPWKN